MNLTAIVTGIVVVLCVVVSIWYFRGKKMRLGKKSISEMIAMPEESNPTASIEISSLIQNLKTKCLHDEETVNRLINAEQEFNPTGSKADWIRAAVERWERDNRVQ